MPRHYKKKTNRTFSPEALRKAITDVRSKKLSIRNSAAKHGVSKSRLFDYLKKTKGEVNIESVDLQTNFKKSQVFPPFMEAALAQYLIKCSTMFHGLTPKATRRLAYEYAERNNIKYPPKWKETKSAGPDWFSSFLKRHPTLSIRTPEATSLARMTSFNRATVAEFQNKLEDVITRYNFTPTQIYNLDETGITTVQRVPKVIAQKGQHQVGQVTSRERGELVTQVGIISAAGHALPPVWIFPRHRFDKRKMMQGIPDTAGLGLVYPSGWMTSENFLKVLKYFTQNVRCSIENKVLLIMDNHESHLSVDGLNFCKTNGIIILTLPPHTSNKLQPLDRTVFGPFKTFYNSGLDSWMLAHPGQTVSIYDIPQIGLQAWDRAANPMNVKSGFRCTGIWPFDRNIFTDVDFLSSYVTNRPETDQSNVRAQSQNSDDECVSPSMIGELFASDRLYNDGNDAQTLAIPTVYRTPSKTPSISSDHSADLNIDMPSTSSNVPDPETNRNYNKKRIANNLSDRSDDDESYAPTSAILTAHRTPSKTPSIISAHSADLNIDVPSTMNVPGSSTNIHKANIDKDYISTSPSRQRSIDSVISLEQINPFPKAAPRKSNMNNRGRRKGRCMIATDTPEKEALEAAKKAKMTKTSKKTVKKKVLQEKKLKKKTIPQVTSSDESTDLHISSNDSTYEIDDEELDDSNADTSNVPEGRFIIVKVYGFGKQSGRNYAAKIVKKTAGGYNVEFYKRKMPSNRFIPTNEEEAFVTYEDVVLVLPVPSEDKRPRFQGMIYFHCNLDEYQLH